MEDMQKELTKRIVNECKVEGTQVTKDLASFLVRSDEILSMEALSADYFGNNFCNAC